MSGFRDKGARATPTVGSSLPHFHGHRERLKTRFQDVGSEALVDYELLELLLFQALPRRDTKAAKIARSRCHFLSKTGVRTVAATLSFW